METPLNVIYFKCLKIIAGYTDTDLDHLVDEQVAKKQKRAQIGRRSTKVMSEVKHITLI